MTATEKALEFFAEHHGWLRTAQALELGIAPRTLYALRDAGHIIQEARGLFRLADSPLPAEPDLITVALKIPQGVICLISALAFHDLTEQVPHAVYLAIPNTAEKPRLSYPPLRFFWLTEPAYSAGIERHFIEGVMVKIYSPEKTIADTFKFRRKIGLGVALDALRNGLRQGKLDLERLQHYAQINRVANIMAPYWEALLR